MIRDLYQTPTVSGVSLHEHEPHEMPYTNPLAEIQRRAHYKYQYRPDEVGVFHPGSKQGLKLRDNGSVDLFARNENGIRIDRNHQTVNVFTNHLKRHIHHSTEWLNGNSKSYVKGHRLLKTKGVTEVIGEEDIIIHGKKNLQITIDKDETIHIKGHADIRIDGNVTAQINGNLDANVKQHAKIEVNEDLNIRSKKNVTIESGQDITLQAGGMLRGYAPQADVPPLDSEYAARFAPKGHDHPHSHD